MEEDKKPNEPGQEPADTPQKPAPPRQPNFGGLQVPSISTRANHKPPPPPPPSVSGRDLIKDPPQPRVRQDWGLELPLVPSSLIPQTYNRFAHTAAVTVVDDPGMICNPLLVFGQPGCGKTHFINYIAYALTAKVGLGKVLLTDGPRLSRAIEKALADGTLDRLGAFIAGMNALVIDDLHKLEISPANAPHIARLVQGFLENKKQVVLSSGLSPRHIAALEEALGAEFTGGWNVDLKQPTPAQVKEILAKRAKQAGLAVAEEILAEIAAGAPSLGEAVKALEQLRKQNNKPGA